MFGFSRFGWVVDLVILVERGVWIGMSREFGVWCSEKRFLGWF